MAPYGILLLIFGKPGAASFAAGVVVALIGEAIRCWGVGYAGKPTRKSTLDAPALVTAGPYAYVRHPLYVGNSLMGIGGLIMASGNASPLLILLFAAAFILFYGTVYGALIPLEEDFLRGQFGDEYRRYEQSVGRIFPRSGPYAAAAGTFRWETATTELHTFLPFLAVVVIMGFKIR